MRYIKSGVLSCKTMNGKLIYISKENDAINFKLTCWDLLKVSKVVISRIRQFDYETLGTGVKKGFNRLGERVKDKAVLFEKDIERARER